MSQGNTLARCLVIPEEYMVNARKSSLTGIYDTLSVSGYATELKGVLCGPSSVDRYVDIFIIDIKYIFLYDRNK